MERRFHSVTTVLNGVGVGVLCLLMLLTSADVLLRYLFNRPIKGTFELTELAMVVTIFFALGYTASRGGHVRVELIVDRLHQRSQAVIDSLTSLFSLAIVAVIVWQGTLFAHEAWLSGEHSALLGIPLFYFKSLVPFGALVLSLEILLSLFHSLRQVVGK